MKIATYNINGINGRLEILLRWLKEAAPDIVCLQELKSENHKFPEKHAIRTLYPNERIYTFWDYLRDAFGRNAGLRLDHFLLNKNVAGRLAAAEVDKEVRGWKGASDHAPVWIELADEDLPQLK